MRRAFVYRLYPNKTQEIKLNEMLETLRRLYNECLSIRTNAWKQEQRSISKRDQQKWFTEARRENEWYGRLNVSTAQAAIFRLDRAFQAFFRRSKENKAALKRGKRPPNMPPGYPKFKARDRYTNLEYPALNNGCKLIGDRIRLQHVGEVRFEKHRALEGVAKNIQVKRRAGRWYLVVSCVLDDVSIPAKKGPHARIRLGDGVFLREEITGFTEMLPSFYEQGLSRLRVLARSASRKQKGSGGYMEAHRVKARWEEHLANQRKDHHWKLANRLVHQFGSIEVMNTKVKPLICHGRPRKRIEQLFNRVVHDAGWAEFIHCLKSVAESNGVAIVTP